MRPSFYIFTVLAALGVWISTLLIDEHVGAVFANAGDTGICAAGAAFSCSELARSWLSNIGGFPIAALGGAWYVTILVLAGVRRFSPDSLPRVPDVLFFSALLSVLYSVFLVVAGKILVGKFCVLCMGLYAVNLGLLITAWRILPDGAKGAFGRMFSVFTTKAFWAAAVLVAISAGGLQAYFAAQARAAVEDYRATQAQLGVSPGEPKDVAVGDAPGRGPAAAPVVVVEFSDFECPFCARLATSLKEAAELRPDLFRYHFKHFPMDNACNPHIPKEFHEHACRAAAASICAGQQGKFWEMHDLLFADRRGLDAKGLLASAVKIGLDPERFVACVEDDATTQRIQADIAEGKALGVQGTPTFFVNGVQQMGARKPELLIGMFEQIAREAEER